MTALVAGTSDVNASYAVPRRRFGGLNGLIALSGVPRRDGIAVSPGAAGRGCRPWGLPGTAAGAARW
ncbi:hypothetical protein PJI17_28185 [Mycobacterium kansasii]|uniref:Uncharacterized protein n=1 Tax=Mycobacterium kansasii TaxID=1768 RepID=A0A1V3XAN7_MYCKA|nr:hypothetical protein BZL30_3350 [Mycobacterium kansasii]